MVSLEELVETYKQKFSDSKQEEQYKNEVIEPEIIKIFNEQFSKIFKNIIEIINQKLNQNVINYKSEGKNRFSIEGKFHRIIFQKGKTEIINNLVCVNIIPLCTWKGVTKHLGPISFVKDPENNRIEWDLPVGSVEVYVKTLLGKIAEDEDLCM